MPRYILGLEGSAVSELWQRKFATLTVDRQPKRRVNVAERFGAEAALDDRCILAPYKPLLLFCVLDGFEEGRFADGVVRRDAELTFRYESLFGLVVERCGNAPDVRMPFHALGNDQVWSVFTEAGRPSDFRDTSRIAELSPGLLVLFADDGFRRDLRRLLIETYFPPFEQAGVRAALGLPDHPADEGTTAREESALCKVSRQKGRDTRFRLEVVTRYGFTCALTGYRLTTEEANVVQAAHIVPWSKSRDDDPRNGLALTPDAHWTFDRGLWTVDGAGRVVVRTGAFTEWTPPGGATLGQRAGRPLCFRDGATLRPDPARLAAHRARFFGGA